LAIFIDGCNNGTIDGGIATDVYVDLAAL